MNPDGSNVTRLTFDDSTDTRADLSPNGPSFIWLRRAPGQLQGEFFTQNLDGTNRKQLTNFGAIDQLSALLARRQQDRLCEVVADRPTRSS